MDYDLLLKSFNNLIETEEYGISLLANTSAFIYQTIEDLNWVGFYLFKDNKLILGPFQGKVACNIIAFGKGVCGTALETKKTIVVPNVHQYDNHIACDANSNSEVVIPIIINDKVYGVFDFDSPIINRFDSELVNFFERVVKKLESKLMNTK